MAGARALARLPSTLAGEGLLLGGSLGAVLLLSVALASEGRLHAARPFLLLPVVLAGLLSPRRRTYLLMAAAAAGAELLRLALVAPRGVPSARGLASPEGEALEHLLALVALGLLTEGLFRLARARRRSEQRYRRLFQRNLAGVFRSGPDLRVTECNAAFARLLGYAAPEELHGRALTEVCPPGPTLEALCDRLLAQGAVCNHELAVRRRDGSTGWVLCSVVRAEEGGLEGTVVDITERKLAETAVLELSLRDGLTGLYNRRELDRVLREEVERARRYERPLALMLVDVDHFKAVNDTHGHLAGDAVLRGLAGVLLGTTRMTDLVARYGGEEFAVVLRETAGPGACELAERLRAEVVRHFPAGRAELPGGLSVSIGVAAFGPEVPSAEALVEAADRALYEAKQHGRNRVVGRLSA